MTELAAPPIVQRTDRSAARVKRRYAAERRFQLYGLIAISAAIGMLGLLLFSIVAKAYPAFTQTYIALDIVFDAHFLHDASTVLGAGLNADPKFSSDLLHRLAHGKKVHHFALAWRESIHRRL